MTEIELHKFLTEISDGKLTVLDAFKRVTGKFPSWTNMNRKPKCSSEEICEWMLNERKKYPPTEPNSKK